MFFNATKVLQNRQLSIQTLRYNVFFIFDFKELHIFLISNSFVCYIEQMLPL